MKLEANVPVSQLPWLEQVKDEEVEFLLVLDRSGSMGGNPWAQVQQAVVQILEMVKDNPKIVVKVSGRRVCPGVFQTIRDKLSCMLLNDGNVSVAYNVVVLALKYIFISAWRDTTTFSSQ